MLKRIAGAAALLALGGAAQAQSSVTVYGIVDNAVEYLNNVGAAKSGLTRMPTLTGRCRRAWASGAVRTWGAG